VTEIEGDLSLDSDQLEEKLEAANPAQPVVVIQYRNRGVSSWLFFTLILAIPLGAILLYHRLVVERYRVQAAIESRKALANRLDAAPASEAASLGARPTPVAPAPPPDIAANSPFGPPGSAPDPATLNPALVSAAMHPPAAAESGPTVVEKTAEPRLRTILPNPSAPVGPAGPSTKPDGIGLAALGSTLAAPAVDLSADPAKDRRPPNTAGPAVHPAVQPLPSKEESERQIAEEAAKKEAEIAARDEIREADLRSRRYQERVKFREELRETMRLHGNDAGPEIDKLARRHGYDNDSKRSEKADRIWRSGRIPLRSKVALIRSLDLPETVILNFLSDDLYRQMGSRKGPRNPSEVRLWAARQLLGFELPATDPSVRPDAAAGADRARSSPR
jgi:hypothetical protein